VTTLLDVTASKAYDGRLVLDQARLTVEAGTVHALVGENGAGKTTLVTIASRGVGLVRQHGSLVPTLTIVENAVLGREPVWLSLGAVADRLRALGARHGLAVDPWARAESLSVGEQQRAEIVIALDRGAEVLFLDEPTAVLAPVEVAGLLAVLRRIADAGGAVVLVTHKLDEVVEVADEVTVLRAGRVVATLARPLDTAAIARAMIGGDPPGRGVPLPAPPPGEPVLRVPGIQVRARENVGVAGVEGNGQRELLAAARGDARIPEDRTTAGLVLDATVEENLSLGRPDVTGWWIDRAARRRHAERLVRDFDVRPPDITLEAGRLSGGNQQKVVVARELTRPGLRVLIAAQPTRGVDLAAQALIHDKLRAAAGQGVAILLVSADLDELFALCHRVVVLYRGEIAGTLALPADDARARIGAWMTGTAA
jgi:simple sugar transport system ATP-binding protein